MVFFSQYNLYRIFVVCSAAVCLCAANAKAFDLEPLDASHQFRQIPLPKEANASQNQEQWFLLNGKANVRNTNQPTLTPYMPAKASRKDIGIIIAPGGGFLGLAMETEGWEIAKALSEKGITAFVLKYRVLPTPSDNTEFFDQFKRLRHGEKVSFQPPEDTPSQALDDAIAALQYVKTHASEFGLSGKTIGFMGFSAGGFLTRSVVTAAQDHMPSFVAPIYPNMRPLAVPFNAPPLFTVISQDDFLLAPPHRFGLIESWLDAQKSVEFHLLDSGGHGFGTGKTGTTSDGWLELFYRWLEVNEFLQ